MPDPCDNTIASQCVAQNDAIDVWFVDFPSGLQTRAEWAFDNQYTNHPDNSGQVVVFTASSINGADARFYAGLNNTGGDYNGKVAWTKCPNWAATGSPSGQSNEMWCEPQTVHYNNEAYPGSFDTYAEQRAVACHEIGHVLGLRHRSGDYCMNSSPGSREELGSHDMECLIVNYPLSNSGAQEDPCE